MGWHIQVETNTLRMSRKAAEDAAAAYNDVHGSDVVYSNIRKADGRALFPYSWLEWADWLCWDEVKRALCRHGIEGKVVFHDAEGDDRGCTWSYKFDGGGRCHTVWKLGQKSTIEAEVDPALAAEPISDREAAAAVAKTKRALRRPTHYTIRWRKMAANEGAMGHCERLRVDLAALLQSDGTWLVGCDALSLTLTLGKDERLTLPEVQDEVQWFLNEHADELLKSNGSPPAPAVRS